MIHKHKVITEQKKQKIGAKLIYFSVYMFKSNGSVLIYIWLFVIRFGSKTVSKLF